MCSRSFVLVVYCNLRRLILRLSLYRYFCSGRLYGLSRAKGSSGGLHPAPFHWSVQTRWVPAAWCHAAHTSTTSGRTHCPCWGPGTGAHIFMWTKICNLWLSLAFVFLLVVFLFRFMTQQCAGWSMTCVTDSSTSWRYWGAFAFRWSRKPSSPRLCRLSRSSRTTRSVSRWSSVSQNRRRNTDTLTVIYRFT